MSQVKILYAEDDEALAFLTKDNLEQNSYLVTHCLNGKNCLDIFKKEQFDLCIFDIMLPGMDGFDLTQSIRRINNDVPILFLSAKILKEDRIRGLRLGADDYLVKPFSIEELLLKINVFLKRSSKPSIPGNSAIVIGKYTFDPTSYTLVSGNDKIVLTQRASELLKFFYENKNQVLKREQILKAVWGSNDYFMGRSLDVFISRLRKILANEKQAGIENLHGIGFRFFVTES